MQCPNCASVNQPTATFCSQCATRLRTELAPPIYSLPSRGTTILVLGILSITVCHLLGPIAWSMGNEELRRIDSGLTSPLGHQGANAGRICGIVSTCLLIVGALFTIAVFSMAATF